jgi:putative cell wall-binding protein
VQKKLSDYALTKAVETPQREKKILNAEEEDNYNDLKTAKQLSSSSHSQNG